MKTPTTIEWPTANVGGETFTLRYSYAANYQLATWGKNIASATSIELAAAMAGAFVDGKWQSAGFNRPLDLADLMEPEQETPLIAAVADALKKAYPELEVISQPGPGTDATTKDDLISGPSPLPIVASA